MGQANCSPFENQAPDPKNPPRKQKRGEKSIETKDLKTEDPGQLGYVEKIQAASDYIREKIQFFDVPIAIALGSGLQAFGSGLENPTVINYTDIPHFPGVKVKGHSGKLIHGYIGSQQVLVFQGRVHMYEGYSAKEAAFYVRVIQFLGCSDFIVTNAAGCVNPNFRPGDFVVIRDQINLTAVTPFQGPHEPRLGKSYFVDMSQAYSPKLSKLLKQAIEKTPGNHTLREGTYVAVIGPNFETPKEVTYFHKIGGDMAGMSTTIEVMAAVHGGLTVGGLSLITNMGSGLGGKLSHDSVCEVAKMSSDSFVKIINTFFESYFLAREKADGVVETGTEV